MWPTGKVRNRSTIEGEGEREREMVVLYEMIT